MEDHGSSVALDNARDAKLDTSGEIVGPTPDESGPLWIKTWSDLDPFTQGYIEALFASACDSRWQMVSAPKRGSRFRPLVKVAFSDLAPETLTRIIADCAAFERHYPMRPFAEYRSARGASFWKQRAPGHRTSDFAPIYFPPLSPTLGDDGKVYLREAGQ